MANEAELIRWLSDLSRRDGDVVGGKNASLGEMIGILKGAGIRVPGGFATTADAYRAFIAANDLHNKIADKIGSLKNDRSNLASVGKSVRGMIEKGTFPPDLSSAIKKAYREMAERSGREDPDVAARSSATAEDLPEASFAGQLETFLNVRGEDQVLDACKGCFASLFTDRAISYREEHGFDHMKVAVSVGIQTMVRSDEAGSGVMFSIDTETGFPRVAVINAAWGLGETVVQGSVDPDEYHVFKPLLGVAALEPVVEKKLGSKQQKMVYASGKGGRAARLDDELEGSCRISDRVERIVIADDRDTAKPFAVDLERQLAGRFGQKRVADRTAPAWIRKALARGQ